MFKVLVFLTTAFCVSNMSSGDSNNQQDDVVQDGQILKVVLQNGKEYSFDNTRVVKSMNNGKGYTLECEDGTNINVGDASVNVKPPSNNSLNINDVKNAKEVDGNLVLTLENGEQVVVKNSNGYEDLGDGNYNIKTGENTELESRSKKNNKKKRNNKKSRNDDDDDNSSEESSALSILCITSIIGFTLLSIVL